MSARVDQGWSTPELSIVAPVYNEEEGLTEFHRRLAAVLDTLTESCEVIYVNDGSSDRSLLIMQQLRLADSRVTVVDLSRNFGKEIALTAGLDHVRGEAAIVIDTDLQDPPELIPTLTARWHDGYDVVYAERRDRRGETWLKRKTADLFYRLMRHVGEAPLPQNTGDFRLVNRRCLDALAACRERRRFMKGLFAWVGFKQTRVIYDRDARFAGRTKWNYWRLWNLALEGVTSFTITPLKLASYLGLATALAAFLYGGLVICRTLLFGRELPGYASLIVVVLFLGAVELIALGVIGEYVGRIFVETKGRPLYLVRDVLAARDSSRLRAQPDEQPAAAFRLKHKPAIAEGRMAPNHATGSSQP
jgi:glycosyltransferase involved in cell wall biosynthesis